MIAVTGGAGFIGGELVRGLNARGRDDLLIADPAAWDAGDPDHAGLAFADWIAPEAFLRDLPRRAGQIEAVLHQGASTDTQANDWPLLMDRNFHFSRALAAACLRCGVRLIYASSAAVYGRGDRGFAEDEGTEAPLNAYGLSKHLFDLIVRRRLPTASAQIVGLRYFNVYGSREARKGKMASLVHRLIRQARSGRMRLFAGSDRFRRDFVAVEDVVAVNLFFLDHPDVSGIFNCGTGRAVPILELARRIQALAPETELHELPFPDSLRGRYQTYTQADLRKLRAAGYARPFVPPEDGLCSVWKATAEQASETLLPVQPARMA